MGDCNSRWSVGAAGVLAAISVDPMMACVEIWSAKRDNVDQPYCEANDFVAGAGLIVWVVGVILLIIGACLDYDAAAFAAATAAAAAAGDPAPANNCCDNASCCTRNLDASRVLKAVGLIVLIVGIILTKVAALKFAMCEHDKNSSPVCSLPCRWDVTQWRLALDRPPYAGVASCGTVYFERDLLCLCGSPLTSNGIACCALLPLPPDLNSTANPGALLNAQDVNSGCTTCTWMNGTWSSCDSSCIQTRAVLCGVVRPPPDPPGDNEPHTITCQNSTCSESQGDAIVSQRCC